MTKIIAFQGVFGAYSHIACQELFPNETFLPCNDFTDAFNAVQQSKADYAVIPIENSNAGRVADVHFLLSQTPLHIVGEHFLRIKHQLIGLPSSSLKNIKKVLSHPQALAQCSNFIHNNNITPIAQNDTAVSCQIISSSSKDDIAAIASKKAAEIYNLKILASNIENADNNTTRFLIMAPTSIIPQNEGQKFITSLIFKSKNIPAALYKALGGFASNNLNITKLESYLLDGKFISAQFYLEVEAHLEDTRLQNALAELNFFSKEYTILGTYAAHPYRELQND
jgi:prephenate dehydratase